MNQRKNKIRFATEKDHLVIPHGRVGLKEARLEREQSLGMESSNLFLSILQCLPI